MIDIHFKTQYAEFMHVMKHKFLNLVGNSAIGKTTFYDMVATYNSSPEVNLGSDHVLPMPPVATVETELLSSEGFVYVADEDDDIWYVPNIVDILNNSNNYFILINRSSEMASFKMGLDDICTLKQVDRLYTFEPVYQRHQLTSLSENIICEDSKSGKQFIESVLPTCIVESAGGKARLGRAASKLCKQQKSNEVTFVYDRAGINYDYICLLKYCKEKNISIISEIDWDSFEAYLLHDPENFVEYDEYPNAEEAAYKKLKEIFPEYDKSKLPDVSSLPIYWKVQDAVSLCKSQPRKMQF